MKRLLTIALMSVMMLTAGAQGKWEVFNLDADELMGQTAQTVYLYEVPGVGTVVVWDWEKAEFRLISKKGMFRAFISDGDRYYPVVVGFYDENGKLEKKFTINLLEDINHGGKYISTAGFYFGGRGDIRKTVARMRSGRGYVRFVANLYNQPMFDIKVKPYSR